MFNGYKQFSQNFYQFHVKSAKSGLVVYAGSHDNCFSKLITTVKKLSCYSNSIRMSYLKFLNGNFFNLLTKVAKSPEELMTNVTIKQFLSNIILHYSS